MAILKLAAAAGASYALYRIFAQPRRQNASTPLAIGETQRSGLSTDYSTGSAAMRTQGDDTDRTYPASTGGYGANGPSVHPQAS